MGSRAPGTRQPLVEALQRVWRLYKTNRQGMLGLSTLVVFVAIALLAPFLANHGT